MKILNNPIATNDQKEHEILANEVFHEKEVMKIRLWQDKYNIFKRLPSGDYKALGSTTEASKLYSYIKKACNV